MLWKYMVCRQGCVFTSVAVLITFDAVLCGPAEALQLQP